MYLPLNTPLMKCPQDNAVRCANAALERQKRIQMAFALGRASIFSNIESPDQIGATFGVGTGVNAANLQNQTLDARASAWLYGDGTQDPLKPSGVAAVEMPTPTTYPLNRGGGCNRPTRTFQLSQQPPMPTPGRVKQAPTIIQSVEGPLYKSSGGGLTGYAPPWSDAFVQRSSTAGTQNDTGVVSWIQAHPWLSLLLAGGGIFAVSQGRKR